MKIGPMTRLAVLLLAGCLLTACEKTIHEARAPHGGHAAPAAIARAQ